MSELKITKKAWKQFEEIASLTSQVMPFENDTPAKKRNRIRKALGGKWSNFSFFCKTYFPHIFHLDWSDDHQEMFEITEKYTGITAITGYRALGKTALMGIVYAIWKILRGETYVIHIAADIEASQERAALTRYECENNVRLRSDFPKLLPVTNDDSDFYLSNDTRIRARSIKQNIRGTINPRTSKRPGLLIIDDVDNEENQGNQGIGKRKMDKIMQQITGALDPRAKGKVIWLGNLVHPNYAICQFEDRIIEEIKEDKPDFNPDDVIHLFGSEYRLLRFVLEKPDGSSAWETQYPTSSLPALKKRFGLIGWLREFMGKKIIEGIIFKYNWYKKYQHLPSAFKIKRVWLYADPAWGEKGCFKAIIAIAWDGHKFYALKIWIRQTSNPAYYRYYYDAYKELRAKYGYKFSMSQEANFGQDRVIHEFDRWAIENNLMPIGHLIKRIYNDKDKGLRIEATETTISTSKILFPDGQDTPTLINQFLTYPNGYLDGPDCLAGCLERFETYDAGKRNSIRARSLVF